MLFRSVVAGSLALMKRRAARQTQLHSPADFGPVRDRSVVEADGMMGHHHARASDFGIEVLVLEERNAPQLGQRDAFIASDQP